MSFVVGPKTVFRVLLWAALFVVTAVLNGRSGVAWAQAPAVGSGDYRPSDGVFIPGRALAGDADATAVEVNPGQLGFLGGSSLVLVGDAASDTGPLSGRGVSLMAGVPLLLNSAIGFGIHGIANAVTPNALEVQARSKSQLAYALRLGRTLSVGATWAHLFGDGLYGGLDTFDAGLSWRPFIAAGLGLMVRDLTAPSVASGAPRLPRLWTGELLLRPMATNRIELGAALTHAEGDRWRRLTPRLRATARLTNGFRIFAELESLPRGDDYAFAKAADYRGSLGVWLDLEHVGAGLAMRTARPSTGENAYGGNVMLRMSGDRYPALIEPQRIDRVSLEGIGGEREYLWLVRRLRELGRSRGSAGILLKIENVQLGWGRIEEVRDIIADMRARGKHVFAYATSTSTREYYLASACEAVIVHPAGIVSLTGLGSTVTFYKGLMDRLGVNVDLVRIAEYKGAMEPFILKEHSPPVRQNRNEILDDVFGRLVTAIASGRGGPSRGFTAEKVRGIIDGGIYTPEEAQKLGLIDAIKDEKEIEDHLRAVTGRKGLSVADPDGSPQRPRAWGVRRVGVLFVEGAIVDGPSEQFPFDMGSFAGSDTLVAALDEFRQDPSIGAVVLRVNSPGGSAFASDVIARAVRALRKAGKPVVVSFGDVAASGGYYIAALADAIFAEPSTTTGSIGIFGYKADVKRLVGELGLSVETFKRGIHADYNSPYRPWTDEEIKLASEKIRHFYGLFLDTVAEGRGSRGITRAKADEIGRGHVWTGAQALPLGLVDRMGGLAAAIDHATRLGRVPIVRGDLPELAVLPRAIVNPLERLVRLGATVGAGEKQVEPGELAGRLLRQLGPGPLRLLLPLLAGPGSGIEARMPFDLDIN
ncbi:MAG TPA: signal peptide peptidase SppA [Polyangia bacterium]|jgi:protease-4|nr:signal peptide peptidase SppA [Polyangia bacterium]